MSDGDDYLQEGFDPRAVTVPRLRSILVTHNVDYPATAKKSQLVALVEDHVLSQAPKLRAQRERAKRSSFGIVNAGSAEDIPDWADHELRPPPSARRSKSPRKASQRFKVEGDEAEAEASAFVSPRKRSVRSSSRQLSHTEDNEEPEAFGSVRRARRTITPQIKAEPVDEDMPLVAEDESVFTDDNPFQGKGSSPPQVKTPSNRRRTTGGDSMRSAQSSRRRTDGFTETPRASRAFGIPDVAQRLPAAEALVEPEEEFTPEAQLELEEAARQGEITLVPRKVASVPARRGSAKTPLLVLFLSLLGAYLAWYRQEKIAVGYCGLGRPAKSILPEEVPLPDALVPIVEPQCEQCPAHAYCYEDYSARCEPGFVLRPHPLSLGGLVPLPPTCEPDGEKARRVKAVADRAVEELRERRAKYECGDLVDEEGHQVDSPAIAEEELKQTVSMKRSKRLNNDEFNDLWAAAIGEVTNRDEVVVETAE